MQRPWMNNGVIAGLAAFASVASSACGGARVQGAKPWQGAGQGPAEVRLEPLAHFALGPCSDVLGQALPVTPERLTLYRSGNAAQLLSESEGLSPLVLENRLHGDAGNTFQAVVDGQLIEIQLPTKTRSGHWLLASHWQEWQQQQGFGARPIRVVERCAVTPISPSAQAQNPSQAAKNPAFGLAKTP